MAEMNINRKTVEGYRARLMDKMAADSVAELARNDIVTRLGVDNGTRLRSAATSHREKTTA